MRPSKDRLLEVVKYVEPGSDDVTFTHAVMAQCFLPIRKLPTGEKFYEVRHGRAALVIDAGRLLNPATTRFEQMDVPSGSAARIALAHINNHIIRAKSLKEATAVPMGESLRDFMDYHRGSASAAPTARSSRGRSITSPQRASRSGSGTGSARQINTQIADAIDFWLEKDRRQRTLWQPVMRVSEQYALAVREHCVPHDMRALMGLYENTRAMDIYVWLSYRLPRVRERTDIFIRFDDLKPIFGSGIAEPRKFRQLFKQSLLRALRWYPVGRVGIEKEGIRLFPSPSPVPMDCARSPYGRTVAGGRRRLRLVAE